MMSEMGNCKDCRHWGNEPYQEAEPHRLCMIITDAASSGNDDLPWIKSWETEGLLLTPPLFGCALFEAKGDEPSE